MNKKLLNTESENKSVPNAEVFAFFGKEVDRFFDKFLGKREEIADENDFKFYEADSPFGPGKIILSSVGSWYDESSNEMGSMEDFLLKMFPVLTKPEAVKGVLAELYDSIFPQAKDPEPALKFIFLCQKYVMIKFLLKRGIRSTFFSE